jgi:hypothetical protein
MHEPKGGIFREVTFVIYMCGIRNIKFVFQIVFSYINKVAIKKHSQDIQNYLNFSLSHHN